MDDSSRRALFKAAASGDERAFASLLDAESVRLQVYIRRRIGRARRADYDADDIFQVVATHAWQSLDRFEDRGAGSFQRWLVAIAEHAISDRLKYLDAKGRGEALHMPSHSAGESWTREPMDPRTSVSILASRREAVEQLERAMNGLDEDVRHLLDLHFLEARSLSSIADDLALPKSVVWDRLQVALAQLKRALG